MRVLVRWSSPYPYKGPLQSDFVLRVGAWARNCMRSGITVTDWPVVPYDLVDHSFFCRPDVGCESVDAGGNHEAQNPRKLVRVDPAVNINLGVDCIDQTRNVWRYRNKKGDNSAP